MTSALEELERIYVRDGALTSVAVVEAARPEESPLHHRFEWDDHVASDLYRLTQAAALIRSVHVTIQVQGRKDPSRVRAFVSTTTTEEFEGELSLPVTGRYVAIGDLDDRGRTVVLENMARDWRTLKRKYEVHKDVLAELIVLEPISS